MSEQDYCKLYLNTPCSQGELRATISKILGHPLDGRTVETPHMSVDSFNNADYKPMNLGNFLDWPYYLEVEATAGSEGHSFVRAVQALIDALKGHFIAVVASCDFEDELNT